YHELVTEFLMHLCERTRKGPPLAPSPPPSASSPPAGASSPPAGGAPAPGGAPAASPEPSGAGGSGPGSTGSGSKGPTQTSAAPPVAHASQRRHLHGHPHGDGSCRQLRQHLRHGHRRARVARAAPWPGRTGLD